MAARRSASQDRIPLLTPSLVVLAIGLLVGGYGYTLFDRHFGEPDEVPSDVVQTSDNPEVSIETVTVCVLLGGFLVFMAVVGLAKAGYDFLLDRRLNQAEQYLGLGTGYLREAPKPDRKPDPLTRWARETHAEQSTASLPEIPSPAVEPRELVIPCSEIPTHPRTARPIPLADDDPLPALFRSTFLVWQPGALVHIRRGMTTGAALSWALIPAVIAGLLMLPRRLDLPPLNLLALFLVGFLPVLPLAFAYFRLRRPTGFVVLDWPRRTVDLSTGRRQSTHPFDSLRSLVLHRLSPPQSASPAAFRLELHTASSPLLLLEASDLPSSGGALTPSEIHSLELLSGDLAQSLSLPLHLRCGVP